MDDQILTVLLAIVAPTLMINSIGLAKLASAGVRTLAAGAARAARTAVLRA
jgi:hypothetical protein